MNRITHYRAMRLRDRIRSQYGQFSRPGEAEAYAAHLSREWEAFFKRQAERRQTLRFLMEDLKLVAIAMALVVAFYCYVFPWLVRTGADALMDAAGMLR
jgi:hypothetical protein